MEKVEYPKWKYHFVKEAKIVSSKDAEDALGADWVDSPAHAKAPGMEEAPEPKASKPKKSLKSSSEDKA